MARAIYDEVVDYEDGTPNNASQIAKDVSEFLHWASYPEMDERKVLGIKTMLVTSVLLGFSIWWKRFKWSYIKSRQVVYKPQKVNYMQSAFNIGYISSRNYRSNPLNNKEFPASTTGLRDELVALLRMPPHRF